MLRSLLLIYFAVYTSKNVSLFGIFNEFNFQPGIILLYCFVLDVLLFGVYLVFLYIMVWYMLNVFIIAIIHISRTLTLSILCQHLYRL